MTYHKKIILLLCTVCYVGVTNIVEAAGYFVEAGEGRDARLYKIGVQHTFLETASWLVTNHLHLYGELTFSQWHGSRYQDQPGRTQTLYALGATPVLRWQPPAAQGFFIEAGIGANYLSKIYDNAGKRVGTQFQFGDHIGVGYRFNDAADLTLKYQHYSNASIKKPNPAVNFATLKLSYTF